MDRRKFLVVTGVSTGIAGCLDATRDDGGGNGTGPTEANATSATGPSTTDDGDETDSTGTDAGSETGASEKNDEGRKNSTEPTGDEGEKTGDEAEKNAEGAEDKADAENERKERPDDSGRTVAFPSCSRAEVTGTFEAGDVAFANTGFYVDGLFGDTLLEDGVEFGDDVGAPFSGTVVFTVGGGSNVTRRSNEIVVEVPNYGDEGTVITSLTTERSDYLGVTGTHENPRARACLSELQPEDGSRES